MQSWHPFVAHIFDDAGAARAGEPLVIKKRNGGVFGFVSFYCF